MARVDAPDFWDGLYARAATAGSWAAGPRARRFRGADAARIAVPGAGRGHDAAFRPRYEVVGFDFSKAAVTAARALAQRDGVKVEFEQRDIFTLGREAARRLRRGLGVHVLLRHRSGPPARVRSHRLGHLRPGGLLLACFFPLRKRTAGPPFPVSRAEVRRRFAASFRLERAQAPLRSVRARQGREWLVFARRT